jgi:hypothetical protein
MTDLRPVSPSLLDGFRFLIENGENKSILPELLTADFARQTDRADCTG